MGSGGRAATGPASERGAPLVHEEQPARDRSQVARDGGRAGEGLLTFSSPSLALVLFFSLRLLGRGGRRLCDRVGEVVLQASEARLWGRVD